MQLIGVGAAAETQRVMDVGAVAVLFALPGGAQQQRAAADVQALQLVDLAGQVLERAVAAELERAEIIADAVGVAQLCRLRQVQAAQLVDLAGEPGELGAGRQVQRAEAVEAAAQVGQRRAAAEIQLLQIVVGDLQTLQ